MNKIKLFTLILFTFTSLLSLNAQSKTNCKCTLYYRLELEEAELEAESYEYDADEQAQPMAVIEDTAKIFDECEFLPSFNGNLNRWLSDNVKYPAVAKKNGIQGRVIVGFVVGKDGSVRDVKVLRGADPSLNAEAVRVVSSMPKWNPGKQNEQAVNCRFTVPVDFKLM